MRDWRRSARYQIGHWLVGMGQRLMQAAERREIVDRIATRLRAESKDPGYERRAKDIAADEVMKFAVQRQATR